MVAAFRFAKSANFAAITSVALALAFLPMCASAGAHEIETGTALICDTQKQAERLVSFLESNAQNALNLVNTEEQYCRNNSGWACNELGTHLTEGKIVPQDRLRGAETLALACQYGFAPACANSMLSLVNASGVEMLREEPRLEDYSILLQEGKGVLPPMARSEILQRACDQGWTKACAEIEGLRTAR